MFSRDPTVIRQVKSNIGCSHSPSDWISPAYTKPTWLKHLDAYIKEVLIITASLRLHMGIQKHNFNGIEIYSVMTSSNGNIFRVTGPLCGEFTSPGEFPPRRPVTRSFDVFCDIRLNKRLNKQPWGWWFETSSLFYDVNVMVIRCHDAVVSMEYLVKC